MITSLDAQLQSALAGAYTIERELGAGGMATVYLAQDLRHHRKVAVKVLRPELASALGSERFLREIETTANLRHPHILPLYDSGDAGGYLFYVMPYVEGESLRDRLSRERQLPIDAALQIAREVADALSYAHARGVIHRDIKPENILIESGHAVVADFGIAKALTEAGGDSLTRTGVAIGTPQYMSPEQAAGERDVDGRSDLYALACVLYEMLAGQPPFTGATVEMLVRQHLTVDAAPVNKLRPAVPASVAAALQRALAKTPADRFNPVAQFAEAIGPHAAAPVQGASGNRRLGGRTVALAAALVLATVAFALLRGRGTGTTAIDRPSVAVLPFTDLSPDRTSEYFGDGIAETIIGALANVSGLDVAARTSAFAFRGKGENAREIGRQLGVATVLDGSVQRAAKRLRVTAQLVKTSDGLMVWSKTFNGDADDIFAMQDTVARAVVEALRGRVLASQAKIATSDATRDRAAYDLYLQGRFFWNKRSVADLRKAADLFHQAIARDSSYAQAWAGLADTYTVLPFYADTSAPPVLEQARIAVERALSLNPRLGEARATLAYLLMLQDWNWTASDTAFQRAIALSPGYANAYKWYADLLSVTGREDEALGNLRRAHELDPLSPVIMANLGNELDIAGQEAAGREFLEKSLELDPANPLALRYLADMYFRRGDTARFFAMRERLDRSSTRTAAPVEVLRRAYAAGGRDAMMRTEIAALGGHNLAIERAEWRVRLGDVDGAMHDLDEALAERPVWITFVPNEVTLAPIRKDPRFVEFLQRMGLASYWQRK